jgi:hypothetical protein
MRIPKIAIAIVALNAVVCVTAAAQTPAVSAEIKRLAFYVGNWSESGEMREDPAKAFKAIAGSETCEWTAGRSAVLCREKTSGPGGGWNGVYILSYDPSDKRYHVRGTEYPGSDMHAIGQIDGDRWIWISDPFPDGSRIRYTFAPALRGARTLTVDAGGASNWSRIVNLKYSTRK